MTVCPECYEGAHGQCIGQGCYCLCQLDLEEPNDFGLRIEPDEDVEPWFREKLGGGIAK